MNNEEKILQILTQMQGDISDIKADVSELKADVAVLKHDVSELRADVEVLKHDVSALKGDIVRLENDHGTKLAILLDSYTQLYAISKEIRSDIIELKSDRDSQEFQIRMIRSGR